MKLSRGKGWFQFDFDKKGRKGIYVGPLFDGDEGYKGSYRYKTLSIMTRRFKLRFTKDRQTKKWEVTFGGLWSSEGNKNQYINYQIQILEFEDKA